MTTAGGTTTAVPNNVTTDSATGLPTVTGTVGNNSDNSTIYIGAAKYIVDQGTDFNNCKAYFKGRTVSLTYYTALDGSLHAAKVTDNFTSSSATVSSTVSATVQGKVESGSNGDVIYLNTDSGTMQIKLDGGTNMEKCTVLYTGKLVKISVAYGTDSYLHAVTIADR